MNLVSIFSKILRSNGIGGLSVQFNNVAFLISHLTLKKHALISFSLPMYKQLMPRTQKLKGNLCYK